MTSRVVPGKSVTIATSSPASLLSKLDFPTFGRPIKRHPRSLSKQTAPTRRRFRLLRRDRSAASSLASAVRWTGGGLSPLPGNRCRLPPASAAWSPPLPGARISAENSPCKDRRAERAAASERASIRSATALGLREIQLSIQKRPARELPGLGQPCTELEAALEQALQHRRAAMPVQLQHVLAGIGVRGREVEREPFVDGLRHVGPGSQPATPAAAPALVPEAAISSGRRPGPDSSDHPDRPDSRSGRYRCDEVRFRHERPSTARACV